MKILTCFILVSAILFVRPAPAAEAAPEAVLKGKVVNSEGQPLAGVAVEEYGYGPGAMMGRMDMEKRSQSTSDSTGAFEIKSTKLPGLLVARKEGAAVAWRQLMPGQNADVRIMLVPASFLAGAVVDEKDQPLPDAQVSVSVAFSNTSQENNRQFFNFLSGPIARDLFTARSGPDGRFRIENFPTNASANLMIKAPGKAVRQARQENFGPDTMQCRAGQSDIRLVVEPTGSIEGKMVGAEGGAPLPQARIALQPEGPGFFDMGQREPDVTGPDGAFRLADIPAGTYRVMVIFGTNGPPASSELVAESVSVPVESGQVARDIQIPVIRGGQLEVATFEKNGHKPLAEVNIGAYKPNFQIGAPTGTNGLATLRLPPGDYQVNAYKEGWRADNTSASIEAGKTNRIEIDLSAPPRITGMVRRPDGTPAAGLPVRVVGDYSMEQADIRTGPDGKFDALWNSQGMQQQDMTFCLLVRDATNNLAASQDLDDDTGPLDLKLAPALSFAGKVESNGKPLTNASASLVFWTGNSGMHLSGMSTATNQPGRFEIPALPPGRRYGLYITAPGYGQKYVNMSEAETEAKRVEIDTVELRLANMKLAGKLVDSDDKPVSGAYVQVAGEDQPNTNVRTDREGRFTFDHVCEGQVRLFAHSGNSHGNMSAEAGDTNVVMKLGENMAMGQGGQTQKVKGTITDPAGKPVAGAQVEVVPMQNARKAKSDTNGVFNLSFTVQPWQRQMGNPMVLVRDLAHDQAAAEELLDDSTNLTVQLKPALNLTGRVEGIDGKPLTGAQVGLWMQVGRTTTQLGEQMTPTDAQGKYTMKGLPVGQDYTVFANAKGYGQSRVKVEVDWDTNRVELTPIILKVADQVISGQVVNENEKPMAGVHVSISGDDQPQSYMASDSKGRFKFKVCEGTVQLFASGQNGFANLQAEAGDTNVLLQLSNNDRGGGGGRRPSLKGKPLPDLAPLGFAPDAAPAGKPVLICLMDIEKRPSRQLMRVLAEQQEPLQKKGITLLAIQSKAGGAEPLEEWKESNPVLFAIGKVADRSAKTKWATGSEPLPWLILTDKEHRVVAEGFQLEELDEKLEEFSKPQ